MGLAVLLLGRVVYGVGIGLAMHGAPMYIAETAPPAMRGALVSGKEAIIVFGILCGYAFGGCLQHGVGRWRYMYLGSVPFAAAMACGVRRVPPSPRWLLLRGRDDEALEALKFVTPTPAPGAFEALRAHVRGLPRDDDARAPTLGVRVGNGSCFLTLYSREALR